MLEVCVRELLSICKITYIFCFILVTSTGYFMQIHGNGELKLKVNIKGGIDIVAKKLNFLSTRTRKTHTGIVSHRSLTFFYFNCKCKLLKDFQVVIFIV